LACMTFLMTALVIVNLQIVVRTYDSVGVAPADMDRARASVGAILASIGIEPIWPPCHETICTGPVKPHEVMVRIVRSGPQSVEGSLGYSVVDVSRHTGSLATIYDDRVHALAEQAGVDPGLLLGRVMAHEIGHILLGTSSHARSGLMRAVWASGELRRDLKSDWVFSGREAADLRRRLVARTGPA
jgi:hypothetical protein